MLALRQRNQAKSQTEEKPRRAGAAREAQAAPDINAIWQSLAMGMSGIQRQLAGGQSDDPHERKADEVAARLTDTSGAGCAECVKQEGLREHQPPAFEAADQADISAAPAVAQDAMRLSGQPLDGAARGFMESRFGHDFSRVRIHTDARAAASARALNALAYTAGRDIVFAEGQYAPATTAGRTLIAHELAHVTQQQAGVSVGLQRQTPDAGARAPATDAGGRAPATGSAPQPAPSPAPPAAQPRTDFVFIMGEDAPGTANPFYQFAERYYRAQLPGATFVTNLRNLTDLFSYISTNVTQPIGNLYIVSHANEDGTLSFGLNAADADAHLDLQELRDALHPAGGGPSALAQVSSQIDARTRIRIKGCDIGRTAGMVELIDEAFGGAGTVTAPTHEQVYGFDQTLADAERRRAHDQRMATFTSTLPAIPPMPAAVSSSLRGAARQEALEARSAAVQARQDLIRDRQQAIAQEELRIAPEVDEAAERAGTYEAISGPMFQRPGTVLFTPAEVQPEVRRLYPHLSATQQQTLVRQLLAPDPRPEATANQQGTFRQHGQRAYRKIVTGTPFQEPRSLAEANRAFAPQFQARNFTATGLRPVVRTPVPGGMRLTFTVDGQPTTPGGAPVNGPLILDTGPEPDNATVIAQARADTPNPDRYNWARVVETHDASNGTTTRSAVAERVVAYLHHGSLDSSSRSHFTQPETNPDFFVTSTFAPPPPPAPAPQSARPAPPPAPPARPAPGGGSP